jgi:hypothetical protein
MQNHPINQYKYNLILCELHFPIIHGKTKESDPNIETHYLVYNIYNYSEIYEEIYEEEYDSDDTDDYMLSRIDNDIIYLKRKYNNLYPKIVSYFAINPNKNKHPTIRNYCNIISKPDYIKPEIGEVIILPTQETIAILKTIWLRIIQKKWKKVFIERKNIMRQRCNLRSLSIRQITGYWPDYCNNLPGIRGMLSELKT